MTYKRLVSSLLLLILSIPSMAECTFADLILANGTVYTGNKNQPIAKTIAIKDSLIVDVSNNFFDKDLEKNIYLSKQELDLRKHAPRYNLINN